MSTTFIAMGIALLAGIGLVVTIGVVSLLSGALHFLFAKPKLSILKSANGDSGFAFSFKWNSSREPVKFDQFKLRLYNPFGSPTQVDISRSFDTAASTFARDLDLGSDLKNLMSATNLKDASIEVEIMSAKEGITHHFMYKAPKFLELLKSATVLAETFNEEHALNYPKPVFITPKRNFIADALPSSSKALKISSNPEFAGEFAGAGAGEVAQENFAVSKVWIAEGCIVCDACEAIFPEVFDVTDDTCLIRVGAPLDNGLLIEEAADACPVEVIKYTKAS